jgi:hypothetical protein
VRPASWRAYVDAAQSNARTVHHGIAPSPPFPACFISSLLSMPNICRGPCNPGAEDQNLLRGSDFLVGATRIFVDGLVEVRDAGMAAITGADANYPRVGR